MDAIANAWCILAWCVEKIRPPRPFRLSHDFWTLLGSALVAVIIGFLVSWYLG